MVFMYYAIYFPLKIGGGSQELLKIKTQGLRKTGWSEGLVGYAYSLWGSVGGGL